MATSGQENPAAGAGAVSSGVEEQYPKLMIKTTSNEAIIFFIKYLLMVYWYYIFGQPINATLFYRKKTFLSMNKKVQLVFF